MIDVRPNLAKFLHITGPWQGPRIERLALGKAKISGVPALGKPISREQERNRKS
jgi:hypothetical protein